MDGEGSAPFTSLFFSLTIPFPFFSFPFGFFRAFFSLHYKEAKEEKEKKGKE